jgi:hypothetical protein
VVACTTVDDLASRRTAAGAGPARRPDLEVVLDVLLAVVLAD